MTAQEQGLLTIADVVRQLTPPQLNALIIVFPPGNPTQISSVLAAEDTAIDQAEAFSRAIIAAKAFVEQPTNNANLKAQLDPKS